MCKDQIKIITCGDFEMFLIDKNNHLLSVFQVWEKAGACGILGIQTPAEFGGIGADMLTSAITWEEQ